MIDQPPQIAYPFRLDQATGLQLAPQDSPQDVQGTALAVLRTPLGHHDSLPDLGLPEVVGTVATGDEMAQLAQDVTTRHDPRAGTIARHELVDMLDQVTVEVPGG